MANAYELHLLLTACHGSAAPWGCDSASSCQSSPQPVSSVHCLHLHFLVSALPQPHLLHQNFSGPHECHDLSVPRLSADVPILICHACYQVSVFAFPSTLAANPR